MATVPMSPEAPAAVLGEKLLTPGHLPFAVGHQAVRNTARGCDCLSGDGVVVGLEVGADAPRKGYSVVRYQQLPGASGES